MANQWFKVQRDVSAYTLTHLTFTEALWDWCYYYHNFHIPDEWVQVQGLEGQRQAWPDTGREGRLFTAFLLHVDHLNASPIIKEEWKECICCDHRCVTYPEVCICGSGVGEERWTRKQPSRSSLSGMCSCLDPAIIFCIAECLRVMVMVALSYISVSSSVDNLKLPNI